VIAVPSGAVSRGWRSPAAVLSPVDPLRFCRGGAGRGGRGSRGSGKANPAPVTERGWGEGVRLTPL